MPKKTTPSAARVKDFHTRLHAWYAVHGRHELPWRKTDDPYAIYLSEIMLQQTQVQTVLSRFYPSFLKRFPTLASLAEASEEEVLKHWQGLGYYSRARNLHKAVIACSPTRRDCASAISGREHARRLSANQKIALPKTIDELMALPGIGRNTAHAIAAFAYRQPVPVMEANVKRVFHRIFSKSKASDKELFSLAETLLDKRNPFDYNQAMMDLGAMICTPRKPDCSACPANNICRGKETPERYPAPKVKKAIPTRTLDIYIVEDASGRIYSEQRITRFLGGMYRFVEIETTAQASNEHGKEAASASRHGQALKNIAHLWCDSALHGASSKRAKEANHIGTITHAYSHFVLEAEVYHVKLEEKAKGNSWYTCEEFLKLPHARSEAKALKLLQKKRPA